MSAVPKNNLVGLSPLWLIGLALSLTFLLVVGIPMLAGPIDARTWFGFGGSLIGGVCTIVAIIVATRNVNRQLRVSLVGREEERLERELPQLRELHFFLGNLLTLAASGHADTILGQIEREYRLGPGIRTEDRLSGILPLANQQDRANAIYHVDMLRAICVRLIAAAKYKSDNASAEKLLDYVRDAIARDEIRAANKIAAYESRLSIFRRELEAYFEN